jgi:HTH-type transcriptional regulator / antitoxin HigA
MPNTAVSTASSGRSPATVKTQYGRLLTGFSPVAIESSAEHDRAMKAAAALMGKEIRSPAETSLLKLLAVLIEDYEQKRYSLGEATPLEVLKELMRAREMQAKDLWPTFGSKGITSEVLNGKRGISNDMARKLGELFRVSPAVFVALHSMQSRIDAVNANKRKEIADGIARATSPGHRVETPLTKVGSRNKGSLKGRTDSSGLHQGKRNLKYPGHPPDSQRGY